MQCKFFKKVMGRKSVFDMVPLVRSTQWTSAILGLLLMVGWCRADVLRPPIEPERSDVLGPPMAPGKADIMAPPMTNVLGPPLAPGQADVLEPPNAPGKGDMNAPPIAPEMADVLGPPLAPGKVDVLGPPTAPEREEVFFLQEFNASSNEETIKLAIVTKWNNQELADCKFYIDRDKISELLKSSQDHRIQRAEDNDTQRLLDICFRLWEVRGGAPDSASRKDYPMAPGTNEQNLHPRFLDYKTRMNWRLQYRGLEEDQITTEDSNDANEISKLHRADSFFESGLNPQEMRQALKLLDASKGHTNSTGGLFGTNKLIYPGTKWCGPGKSANSSDDLGYFKKTDECCRTHDLCKERIAPGVVFKGLKNTSPFFKLSCACDDEFYDCLVNSDSHTSNIIGNLYFDIFKRECFAFDHPPKYKCITHETFLRIVCDAYEKNADTTKVYYWKPAKEYKRIPFNQLYTEILSHYKHFNHFTLFKVTN